MEGFLYNLEDGAKIILIICAIILLIKIIYWCWLYKGIANIEEHTIHIDNTLTNTENAIIEQNKVIIENQKKIIELLEKN